MGSGSVAPPTPAQNSRHHHRNRRSSGDEENGQPKRPRLVFTDIQKRTLQVAVSINNILTKDYIY